MDRYSGKRACGWISALRKGSNPATHPTDEPAEFCNRIGCSGRLKHTVHPRNNFLEKPKTPKPSTRSSLTNVRKPLEESRKKPFSKTETGSGSDDSKSRDAESSNTKMRKKDAQIGSSDSSRRRNTVKKRSTQGETSGVSSVRTRRPINLHGNSQTPVRSTHVNPDMTQTELSRFSPETSGDTSSSMMPDRNCSGQYTVDSIANVLLALERIDQEEGLTYEQIMSLEGNLLFGGYNIYDQHRGMRLDIDNMSYEELLALEEKMGIVSTALSEEELSKCLKISVYQPFHSKESRIKDRCCLDDTKCSVCQEEFTAGDEIGRLGCDHVYHATCINQWMQLKNWCPICKSSAKPSNSS